MTFKVGKWHPSCPCSCPHCSPLSRHLHLHPHLRSVVSSTGRRFSGRCCCSFPSSKAPPF
jgi:hypothetical protein